MCHWLLVFNTIQNTKVFIRFKNMLAHTHKENVFPELNLSSFCANPKQMGEPNFKSKSQIMFSSPFQSKAIIGNITAELIYSHTGVIGCHNIFHVIKKVDLREQKASNLNESKSPCLKEKSMGCASCHECIELRHRRCSPF